MAHSLLRKTYWQLAAALVLVLMLTVLGGCNEPPVTDLHERETVIFWHFWGGRDRPIVEGIVKRFNESQDRYTVRAIALPGSNLDLKFFLSVAGGDPPDLLNHDEPVVADWAHRGVLTPLDELANADELERLHQWLFPTAWQLGEYDQQLYALCNGLDIRALYCNKTLLDEHQLDLPTTIDDLDRIAETIAPADEPSGRMRMGYLPHPGRLWAWGVVFGGNFADLQADDPNRQITADSPKIAEALDWMAGYSRRYGPGEVAAFRSGEQALTGAAFPLLANRRYAVVMDGQWRVRDIAEAQAAAAQSGQPIDEFAVTPLPSPAGGRRDAGWVNGNFFVVPRQARQKQGAWEFMKFWVGFEGSAAGTAQACADGGWIPVSQSVVQQPAYQQALVQQPLLSEFVRLASSPNQLPVPPLPVGSIYNQQVTQAAQDVLYRGDDPEQALRRAADEVRARLREVTHDP